MKTNWVRAALACAALAFTTTAAMAGVGTPISGTDVGLEHDPAGIAIPNGTTDANGSVTFRGLTPGKYILRIDGQGLVRAMDKLQKAAPAKSEGSSVSLGLGGMFGGSKRSAPSHQGAGPVDSTHGSTSSSSSTGVGVGATLPIGGDSHNPDTNPMAPSIMISVDVGGAKFSSTTPYCRDVAGGGMRFGLTVPQGGGSVALSIHAPDSILDGQ